MSTPNSPDVRKRWGSHRESGSPWMSRRRHSGLEGACECTIHGWLLKDHKKGKKRWFALVDGDLYWFKKQECDVHSKKATSWLPLDCDAVCAKTGAQSFIVRSEGRELELAYAKGDAEEESPEEKIDEWVAKVREVIEGQRKRLGTDAAQLRRAGTLTWKKSRYYFVLRERYVSWFKNEKAKKPLGKLPMHGVELDRKTADSVTLARQGEEMDLVMASPREADEWYAAFASVADALRNREKEDAEALSKIADRVGVALTVVADGVAYTGLAATKDTAIEAKEHVIKNMPCFAKCSAQLLADQHLLKVEGVDMLYVIPEHVPMKQLPVFVLCSRTLNVPTLELVSKQALRARGVDLRDLADTSHMKALIERSLAVEDKREILMGQPYSTLLAKQTAAEQPDTEFLPARLHLLKYVSDVLPGIRAEPRYNPKLPQYTTLQQLAVVPPTVTINCTLPKNLGVRSSPFPASAHPAQVRDHFHRVFLDMLHAQEHEFPRENYHLKVVGVRSYLDADIPLLRFDYICSCLAHYLPISLSLINPEAGNPPDLEMEDFLYNITRVRSVPPDTPIPEQRKLIVPPPPTVSPRSLGIDIPPPPLSPRSQQELSSFVPPPPMGGAPMAVPPMGVAPPVQPPVQPPIPVAYNNTTQGCRPPVPRLNLELSQQQQQPATSDVATAAAPTAEPTEEPPKPIPQVGMSTMGEKFRVRAGVLDQMYADMTDKLVDFTHNLIDVEFTVRAHVLYGIVPLCPAMSSTPVPYQYALKAPGDTPKVTVAFNQWVVLDVNMYDLPMESVLRLEVHVVQRSGVAAGSAFCLGWTNYLLVGRDKWFRNGVQALNFWAGAAPAYIGTTCENLLDRSAFALEVELEGAGSPGNPARAIYYDKFTPFETGDEVPPPHVADRGAPPAELLSAVAGMDKMRGLTSEQAAAVYRLRSAMMYYPVFLPYFLLAVDWTKWHQVVEARRMLYLWAEPEPRMGLELLDWRFADKCVREYAVMVLDKMADGELAEFLVQLVGVVKFEPFHDSPLARFLVRRALQNHTVIGHPLFWLLKSEIHTSVDRLGMILEAYLRGCDAQSIAFLAAENKMINDVASVAGIIKVTAKDERLETLRYQLRKLNFPPRFQIPLFSDRECAGLVLASCKYMKSKKMPLWLVFRNADAAGDDTYVMYKRGDDLRQDVLTLQLLRLLDRLLAAEGLGTSLLPYGVMSTGFEEGMVEIVRHAETIGGINRAAGGTMAVLRPEVLRNWLRAKNPADDDYARAVEHFAVSCAGYCVFTYVFGIADRHNDNIMIREDGRLFHIDFGHILGHFKKKLGVKRERAPMIFTPQMADVLGGAGAEKYRLFQDCCCRGFRILRHHVDEFLALLNLTLCCDLPEVQTMDDVLWVRDHLRLDLSDDQADKFFLDLIEESLHTVSTQLMDMIHIIAN